MDNWHHSTDPHKVVPNGFRSKTNKYTVTGFCSPAGKEVIQLMANIRYDNGSETTRRYVHTLRDFIVETSHADYVNHVEKAH
jgi:hypothetical protein